MVGPKPEVLEPVESVRGSADETGKGSSGFVFGEAAKQRSSEASRRRELGGLEASRLFYSSPNINSLRLTVVVRYVSSSIRIDPSLKPAIPSPYFVTTRRLPSSNSSTPRPRHDAC